MAEKGRYRAGAIGRTGQGNFGHGLHLPYREIDQIDFIAVSDPDEAGRKKAAEETGATQTYADFQDMLEHEDLDIVSVCPRWVDCHKEMILACLEAGCHVYSEKPIAMTLEEGDRIVAAADQAGLKVAVAHQGVYLPQVHEVKRLLEAGKLGKVLSVYAFGKQDHRGGGEDMMVLGTHQFNLMQFFFGKPAWMTACVQAHGHEITPADVREANEPIGWIAGDDIVCMYGFESGPTAYFASRADQPGKGRSYGMEIVGEKGKIALDGGAGHIAFFDQDVWAPWEGDHSWTPMDGEKLPLQEGNRLAILDLMDAIEADRDPIASARLAVGALEMIHGAYWAQVTGERVLFPLADRTHPLERFRQSR